MHLDAKEGNVVMQQTANDVDQVKRLSSLSPFAPTVEPYASSQGTNCVRAFINGSLHQTRPRIITLHVVLITREQQHGSFKEAYSRNGWQRVHFFGSTENVRPSHFHIITSHDVSYSSWLGQERSLVCGFLTTPVKCY